MKIECPRCLNEFDNKCPKCFKLRTDKLYVVCSKCRRVMTASVIREQMDSFASDSSYLVSYSCDKCGLKDEKLVSLGGKHEATK